MPLEVQGHTVPNLKALISDKLEPRGLRCGIILILCHALLNKTILLHKKGLVDSQMNATVHTRTAKEIGNKITSFKNERLFLQPI